MESHSYIVYIMLALANFLLEALPGSVKQVRWSVINNTVGHWFIVSSLLQDILYTDIS